MFQPDPAQGGGANIPVGNTAFCVHFIPDDIQVRQQVNVRTALGGNAAGRWHSGRDSTVVGQLRPGGTAAWTTPVRVHIPERTMYSTLGGSNPEWKSKHQAMSYPASSQLAQPKARHAWIMIKTALRPLWYSDQWQLSAKTEKNRW